MGVSNTTAMKWASALSLARESNPAAAEAVIDLKMRLGNRRPDVAFLFVSTHHRSQYAAIAGIVHKHLAPRHLVGCSGDGVIGDAHEAEQVPAVALAGAVLPNVEVKPIRLQDTTLPGLDSSPRHWETALGVQADAAPSFVLFADPFSFHADDMLAGLDFAYPKATKVGGLASGARRPGQSVLFCDDKIFHDGAVALALSGDLRLETFVAQGCRPVGPVLAITKCERNVLLELDHRPALEVLRALYRRASSRDQRMMPTSLHLGLAMDPFRQTPPGPGDFLIRTPVALDVRRRALVIASLLHEGQTVQFHLRDPKAASEDLTAALRRYTASYLDASNGEVIPPPPRGALLFSCLARGRRLYGTSDHDAHAFRTELGDVPLTGFFCNGEIGPAEGTTYLHGFTSCFGIFRAKSD